jgi:signal peptide peptidase SppA
MKLEFLIRQLYAEPALILPASHASIRTWFEARMLHETARAPGTDFCGNEVEIAGMTIADGIAEIPIGGVMGVNLRPFQRGSGAVDVADISAEIDQAQADPAVKKVLFNVDSPGGMVNGTPELADKISSMTKPAFAFTNGLMASAAYWAMSGVRVIMATKTANVGSIGVYMPVFDESRAYEKAGIKVELIKAGALKGIGFPGTSLSESGKAHLQSRVDEIYGMFKQHVQSGRRGMLKDEDMQGQSFMGETARQKGLVDLVVRDKAQVLSLLKS